MAVRTPKGNRPARSTAAVAPAAGASSTSAGTSGPGAGATSASSSEPTSDDLLEAAADLAGDIGAAELTRRLADNIRALRKTRGYSLDDMARRSGVSRASFHARVRDAALTHLGAPCEQGPVLAVLHKGVIKAVLAALTGRPPAEFAELPVTLGSLHRLRWRPDGAWELASSNETAHLGELDLGC